MLIIIIIIIIIINYFIYKSHPVLSNKQHTYSDLTGHMLIK